MFVIFHIVLAGILKPQPFLLLGPQRAMWARFGAMGAALLVGAFLITQIVNSLRLKGRELLRV